MLYGSPVGTHVFIHCSLSLSCFDYSTIFYLKSTVIKVMCPFLGKDYSLQLLCT
ncbi:hypothetical protein GBAR_LOCUS1258 [Geodia barretti]|uniref:Uncharacterized protein n=1 Tax=Geodia barretti TaxID=519541 RepID=A0AA35W0A7_GEOBA|nr:hypothetical protein GBAR_LOCUS1258 [Geodia barretti]